MSTETSSNELKELMTMYEKCINALLEYKLKRWSILEINVRT